MILLDVPSDATLGSPLSAPSLMAQAKKWS